jgi:hypothetical protein
VAFNLITFHVWFLSLLKINRLSRVWSSEPWVQLQAR